MNFKILENRIHTERLKANLTQADLSEKLDESTVYIGQIERSERKFSIETLVNIADILNTSAAFILHNDFKNTRNHCYRNWFLY